MAPPDAVLEHDESGPRLIGSRCRDCSTLAFPRQDSCPRCTSRAVEREPLPTRGVLWTWTVQTFPPKPPYRGGESFEPFGVGYVELPGNVRVEARLTESDPERLRIGMPMRLVEIPVPGGKDGATTFAFEPEPADA